MCRFMCLYVRSHFVQRGRSGGGAEMSKKFLHARCRLHMAITSHALSVDIHPYMQGMDMQSWTGLRISMSSTGSICKALHSMSTSNKTCIR